MDWFIHLSQFIGRVKNYRLIYVFYQPITTKEEPMSYKELQKVARELGVYHLQVKQPELLSAVKETLYANGVRAAAFVRRSHTKKVSRTAVISTLSSWTTASPNMLTKSQKKWLMGLINRLYK
jgi:CHAD domain-containing protein